MGQKTSPIGFRLGITHQHQSNWFIDPRNGSMKKNYPFLIIEDKLIRDVINRKFPNLYISHILITRQLESYSSVNLKMKIQIYTHNKKLLINSINPFLFIKKEIVESKKAKHNNIPPYRFLFDFLEYDYNKKRSQKEKGQDLEKRYKFYLKKIGKEIYVELLKYQNFLKSPSLLKLKPDFIYTQICELNHSFQFASLCAKYLVYYLERRESLKKILKDKEYFPSYVSKFYLHGMKIKVSGRIEGVDMAEHTYINYRRIPLSTLSASIDYCCSYAKTMHGILGIKVWTYKLNKWIWNYLAA